MADATVKSTPDIRPGSSAITASPLDRLNNPGADRTDLDLTDENTHLLDKDEKKSPEKSADKKARDLLDLDPDHRLPTSTPTVVKKITKEQEAPVRATPFRSSSTEHMTRDRHAAPPNTPVVDPRSLQQVTTSIARPTSLPEPPRPIDLVKSALSQSDPLKDARLRDPSIIPPKQDKKDTERTNLTSTLLKEERATLLQRQGIMTQAQIEQQTINHVRAYLAESRTTQDKLQSVKNIANGGSEFIDWLKKKEGSEAIIAVLGRSMMSRESSVSTFSPALLASNEKRVVNNLNQTTPSQLETLSPARISERKELPPAERASRLNPSATTNGTRAENTAAPNLPPSNRSTPAAGFSKKQEETAPTNASAVDRDGVRIDPKKIRGKVDPRTIVPGAKEAGALINDPYEGTVTLINKDPALTMQETLKELFPKFAVSIRIDQEDERFKQLIDEIEREMIAAQHAMDRGQDQLSLLITQEDQELAGTASLESRNRRKHRIDLLKKLRFMALEQQFDLEFFMKSRVKLVKSPLYLESIILALLQALQIEPYQREKFIAELGLTDEEIRSTKALEEKLTELKNKQSEEERGDRTDLHCS